MNVKISINSDIHEEEVIALYHANQWSSANKPKELLLGLKNSHTLVTAHLSGELVGIANAISDGYLVVYYPHMLVIPKYQGQGIGRKMMQAMQSKYKEFHQQILTSDANAIKFYQSLSFKTAGNTQSMWIYRGNEHS